MKQTFVKCTWNVAEGIVNKLATLKHAIWTAEGDNAENSDAKIK